MNHVWDVNWGGPLDNLSNDAANSYLSEGTYTIRFYLSYEGNHRAVVVDYTLGDVNGDGKVTPSDAIMILYHYFNVEQTGFNAKAADINGDGNISPADAIEALYMYFDSDKDNAPRRAASQESTEGFREPE